MVKKLPGTTPTEPSYKAGYQNENSIGKKPELKSQNKFLTKDTIITVSGVVIYFVSLINVYSYRFGGSFDISFIGVNASVQILINAVIFSIPAIVSSFAASFLSRKNIIGIRAVFISGILVISLPIPFFLHRGDSILFFFVLGFFFVLPIAGLSAFFAVIFAFIGAETGNLVFSSKNEFT